MPSPTVATGPLVEPGWVTFRVPDHEGRLTGARLATDSGFPAVADRFTRDDDGWTLRIPAPPLDRFEYAVELDATDGTRECLADPGNPLRVSGAFGEKSAVELPGYAPPAWLHAPRAPGRTEAIAVESSALASDVHAMLWAPADADADEPLGLLVAHDGPELDHLARLIDYAATQIAAGTLPRHRVALLHPGDRNQWYSASALYGRTLATRILPAIADAVAVERTVGMGVSLGGLAMLHAHRRFPDAFAGLFLQSGSFFLPRFDAHESAFPRYRRIVRFVRSALRDRPRQPIPVTLTCGEHEENAHNNRVVAGALAAQGYGARLVEGRDLHNFVAWRDAWHPHLTDLLREVWR